MLSANHNADPIRMLSPNRNANPVRMFTRNRNANNHNLNPNPHRNTNRHLLVTCGKDIVGMKFEEIEKDLQTTDPQLTEFKVILSLTRRWYWS